MHCPHPRGITVLPVPIPAVLPWCLSPSPRYYRGACPHPRGITVNSVAITADLPRFSRCPHPHAAPYFTAITQVNLCKPAPPVNNTTTTTTTVVWPFARDYPSELVPEETFTHSPILIIIQPLSASSIYYVP